MEHESIMFFGKLLIFLVLIAVLVYGFAAEFSGPRRY